MERRAFGENGRALREADGDVDKVSIPGRSREEGSVSSEGSNTSKKRMSFASDMSKEQVEQLVTRLTMGEMKSRWFDEIFAKVKTELVDSPQFPSSDTIDTPSTEDNQSPLSMPIDMAANPQRRLYQATVEDDPEEIELSGSSNQAQVPSSDARNKNEHSPNSSVVSDSPLSRGPNRPPMRRFSENATRRPLESNSNTMPRPTVRFADTVPVVLNSRSPLKQPREGLHSIRPGFPARVSRDAEPSAVDASWGQLFDAKGEPTARLGQFVRGIANYIIAEYTPTNSLVLTPDKLLAFYRRFKLEPETKIESETMPFDYMFDAQGSRDYNSLELLYQDLGCSYHLVQGKPNSSPRIPALTPEGFQQWVTLQIQAFPDEESQRLNCIIGELPITADGPLIDGKAERLPRQLSRHLLPATVNQDIHDKIISGVHRWTKEIGLLDALKRESNNEYYTSSRYREGKSGRYRPEDYRGGDGARSRHKARDGHGKPSDREPSRKDAPSRFTYRANSDSNMRRSDALPPIITSGKSRSPTSKNRYRSSVPIIHSAGGADEYGLSSSSYAGPTAYSHWPRSAGGGERRNREQEYRVYHGRGGSDSTPRTIVGGGSSKRQSLILEADPREEAYDVRTG